METSRRWKIAISHAIRVTLTEQPPSKGTFKQLNLSWHFAPGAQHYKKADPTPCLKKKPRAPRRLLDCGPKRYNHLPPNRTKSSLSIRVLLKLKPLRWLPVARL